MESIVFFTDSYDESDDSTSKYNRQIVERLIQTNLVTVVCPMKSISEKLISYPKQNLYIRRIPIPFRKTRNIFFKLFKFSIYSLSCVLYLFFKRSPRSIYVVHTSPPTIIPILVFLIQIRNKITLNKKKLILLAHDIYPDIFIDLFPRNNFIKEKLIKIIKSVYKFSYKRFDIIISCSEGAKQLLMNNYAVNDKNVKVVFNWSQIDNQFIDNKVSNYFSKKSKQDLFQRKILLIGNIGILHMSKQVSSRLIQILNKDSKLKIDLFIRGAYSFDIITRLCKNKNVLINNFVEPKELVKAFIGKHITLVSLSRASTFCAFPSRISTATSLSSPILFITDFKENNPLADFILRNKIGTIIENQDSQDEAFNSYSKLIENYELFQKNSKDAYLNYFQYSKGISKLIKNIIE